MGDPEIPPKVVAIPPKMRSRLGSGSLLIPTPHEVNAVMQRIAKGQVMTVGQIRRVLAAKYETDQTCPLVAGIHVWICAHAAEEAAALGKKRITPY